MKSGATTAVGPDGGDRPHDLVERGRRPAVEQRGHHRVEREASWRWTSSAIRPNASRQTNNVMKSDDDDGSPGPWGRRDGRWHLSAAAGPAGVRTGGHGSTEL